MNSSRSLRKIKKRKPRGRKLKGYNSYNLCPYCYGRNCDSYLQPPKVSERLLKGLCPACGHKQCTCKSSLKIKE